MDNNLFKKNIEVANQVEQNQKYVAFNSPKEIVGVVNHKMALGHYRVVKNMLISYDKKPMGFF